MMEIFSRAQHANSVPPRDAQQTWQCCVDDLLALEGLHAQLSATAQCAAMFLRSHLLINKAWGPVGDGMGTGA